VEVKGGADELASLAHDVNDMADRLQELARLKKTFVASITHALRSPLSAIEKEAKALQAAAARLSAADCDSLGRIMNSVGRLNRFVTNLLDMADTERGEINYDPRPTQLTELVEDTVFFFLPKAAEGQITLSFAAEPGLTVYADHDLVVHVLTNIISNAIKFTPSAGTIRVELKSVPQGAECSVTDSGAGIPAAKLARIFQPSERGGVLSGREVGQGLVVAKSIIAMHGGRIGVESEVGRGSRFFFFLPFFATPAAPVIPGLVELQTMPPVA
jgi:signal transduction histidine kinase